MFEEVLIRYGKVKKIRDERKDGWLERSYLAERRISFVDESCESCSISRTDMQKMTVIDFAFHAFELIAAISDVRDELAVEQMTQLNITVIMNRCPRKPRDYSTLRNLNSWKRVSLL